MLHFDLNLSILLKGYPFLERFDFQYDVSTFGWLPDDRRGGLALDAVRF